MDLFTASLIALVFFSTKLWVAQPRHLQYDAITPLELGGYRPKRHLRALAMRVLIALVLSVAVGYGACAVRAAMYGNPDEAIRLAKAAAIVFVIASLMRYVQIQDPNHPENH
jgi:hypothetical protein